MSCLHPGVFRGERCDLCGFVVGVKPLEEIEVVTHLGPALLQPMKIFVLKRTDEVGYDEFRGFTIVAESEEKAREAASNLSPMECYSREGMSEADKILCSPFNRKTLSVCYELGEARADILRLFVQDEMLADLGHALSRLQGKAQDRNPVVNTWVIAEDFNNG